MILVQFKKEKAMEKNLNFVIDLADITMVAKDTEPTEEAPQTFSKVWNLIDPKLQRKWYKDTQNKFNDMNKQEV